MLQPQPEVTEKNPFSDNLFPREDSDILIIDDKAIDNLLSPNHQPDVPYPDQAHEFLAAIAAHFKSNPKQSSKEPSTTLVLDDSQNAFHS